MFSFDSLTLKYFVSENKDFILGSVVQKVQLPSRYEIILTIRNLSLSKNKKLYININPKYPHICFIDEKTQYMRNIEIPSKPPMFCMQLRKYINGSKIKDLICVQYERILEFYFDYVDEIGSIKQLCLSAEFMGKYSNVILYEKTNKTIIGAAHNVSSDKSSVRELYGGIKYIYPPLKQKLDILNISYATFHEISKETDSVKLSDSFYYLNQALINNLISNNNLDFSFLQELVSLKNKKFICDFWGGNDVNSAIDNYFSKIIFDEKIKSRKMKLNRVVNPQIKKLQKIINDAPDEQKAKEYKQKADFIMANLYCPENIDFEIDNTISLSDNAQKYYKLYKKAQSGYLHIKERIDSAKEQLKHYEEVLFSIENSSDFSELDEIDSEFGIAINKNNTVPKIIKIEFKGWDIYIGKNSKQNDYLISKIARSEDLWFHGLNYPSAHIVLKVPNNKKEPSKEIIEYCAKITKENSKARSGGKASVIMTKRKNLKKPPNTYLGYVTYKNEIEIVI